MQSSPPERAWNRPSSPAGSQYSLDLGPLDQESRSGGSSPLPEQHIDRIRSEDIDGPSDFTINMGRWMRGGGTIGRGTRRSTKSGFESIRERHDEGGHAKESLLTPRKAHEDEQSASHHTPTNTPPQDSPHDARPSHVDLTEWDPETDGEGSTPQPPMHKHFLQPTVEDYNSELSPARLPSIRKPKSVSNRTQVPTQISSPPKEEPDSPGRPSSETLSPVRSPVRSPTRSPVHSPVLKHSHPRNFSSQSNEAMFEKQMDELRVKCQQLEHLNQALGDAIDEERRLRGQDNALHERREKDLKEMKDQAYMHRDDFRKELGELKAKGQVHEREREETRREMDRMRQQHAGDTKAAVDAAQRQKSDQSAEVRALEQDLELARRSRDEAEASERVVREELERYHASHDAELDRMQYDLTQVEDPEERVRELEEELRQARLDIEKMKKAKNAAEDAASNARGEVASLMQSRDGSAQQLMTANEDLQSEVGTLRQQLQDSNIEHKSEVERIRSTATQAAPAPTSGSSDLRSQLDAKQAALNTTILERDALRDDLEAQQSTANAATIERDALRDDLEAQQSTLNAAILERDEAQDALTTAKASSESQTQQVQTAQQALSDLQAVNIALDTKVSAAIAKREDYWRSRLEASEVERKVMAKALLRQWGREEVGIAEKGDGRQGYEYQFVQKKAKRRSVDAISGA